MPREGTRLKMLLATGVTQNVTTHQGSWQQWDPNDSGSASLGSRCGHQGEELGEAGEQRGGCHSAPANFYSLELHLKSRAEVTPMCGLSVGGRAREAAVMSRVSWRVWCSVG